MSTQNPTIEDGARQAVEFFKTHLALAQALGYTDLRNVSPWAKGLRPFPPEHCVTIERLSGGVVTRKMLRPYDWKAIWPELIDLEATAQSAEAGSV
jgi:DNA-binding transcriptional regulator YdaS (Cro superfamily)